MPYDSPEFVFTICFGLCFFCWVPAKLRSAVIFAISCFWYFCWSASWGTILVGLLASDGIILFLARRRGLDRQGWFFPFLLFLNCAFFAWGKLQPILGHDVAVPPGFSFFMLILLGHLVDRWRGSRTAELSFFWGPLFFPLLMGGPVERSATLEPQLHDPPPLAFGNGLDGLLVFGYGFLKNFSLNAPLQKGIIRLLNGGTCSLAALAVASLLGTFQTYVVLSSYADMGRGAARCFGIRVSPNFMPFLYAKDPGDFWRRWNITLGTWVRDYITLPLMLRWGRRIPGYLILVFSFLLIGLWHGISWNWLIFGFFNGFLVVLFLFMQNQLAAHGTSVRVLGRFSVFLLFLGNGLFQYPAGPRYLVASLRSPSIHFPSLFAQDFTGMLLPLALLLSIEFFQEKYKNPDFFFKFPRNLKIALGAVFLAWFAVMVHDGTFVRRLTYLPLYFHF